MASPGEFQSKILRRQRTPEEYRVYRAGLEWDLTDPIVLDGPDDFKSTKRWSERLKPYNHQVTNLITFCRRLPVTLLADDVGLGKTISAGLIVSELIERARVSKILIVCPKLLGPQWKDELQAKFEIDAQIAIGKELKTAEPAETGAVITTYNSARLYLNDVPDDRFQMLILDEAHKLRNLYGVEKTPQVAKRFRKALEARRFRFVLMLTATPIQNRLWDLYSLVDLLTVARGHQNPFGGQGLFARRFIADNREQARQLKLENREEFRSIVYGYMSRVRRGDAKLQFPDRVVQMHRVDPSPGELALIKAIAGPIQLLNRLAQISILQALTSSPDALNAQLTNMARKGTVPAELAATVRAIVRDMAPSAKLRGLSSLVGRLEKENPGRWRLVVFTGRRETQTTIQTFLEGLGIKVGIINGDSGQRNQDTITRFRKDPPELRVIVSTEAGSEGVNLQVANVLVNYDLPWNPMIVEQRIGRVQRLASDHAFVSIFNIMLRGTFEEYIVGRLMEKLQMASHAIGDIESLLQGSDIGDEDGDGAIGFEDKILALVLSALQGKDPERELRLAEQSIAEAKATLEREEANINSMLGGMDGAEYVGPRAPKLPPVERSMAPDEFTLAALKELGATIRTTPPDMYVAEKDGHREYIRFQDPPSDFVRSTLYSPQSAAFQRLVDQVVATGVYQVEDADPEAHAKTADIARAWAESFGATLKETAVQGVRRSLKGSALLRVRATVAHDAYERLLEVPTDSMGNSAMSVRDSLAPLPMTVENPSILGLSVEELKTSAEQDPHIAEFSRFYLERRNQEIQSAAGDERKRQKLEDEFTPRLSIALVGADGRLTRELTTKVRYSFEAGPVYEDTIRVVPSVGQIVFAPAFRQCEISKIPVPVSCLGRCEITGAEALQHHMVKSDVSGRFALPAQSVVCDHSGKRVLRDEAAVSAVTGKLVANVFLRSSPISGMRAEPEHFARCSFTNLEVLKSELSLSLISGKPYVSNESARSSVSGNSGHKSEFIECYETRQTIARAEAETCEATSRRVRPGILEACEATNKRVLPSELELCAATSKRVLKTLLDPCAVSGARVLPSELERCAVTSKRVLKTMLARCEVTGKRVLPSELEKCAATSKQVLYTLLEPCAVSGKRVLPSELEQCAVTSKRVLKTMLERCELTGKRVLPSELEECAVTSKRVLHTSLDRCAVSGKRVLPSELERCAATSQRVLKSLLEPCEVSGKLVLPSELERCAVTSKRALKALLVTSSLSGSHILETSAVRSTQGTFCTTQETQSCAWSGERYHPDDLKVCGLTGLRAHKRFFTEQGAERIRPLADLLAGTAINADKTEAWDDIATQIGLIRGGGKTRIESAILSPSQRSLALCCEVKTMLGLRVHQFGAIYHLDERRIVGRAVEGKRRADGWLPNT